jgi:hypothetical protein
VPRLGLLNMTIGFALIFLAAALGPFVATEITSGYLRDKALLETWRLLLQKSSHGHTNLFGMLHVAFGLTLPYSALSGRLKKLQTVGLVLGSCAMGPVLLVRAALGPVDGIDLTEIVAGAFLSCALAAIALHAYGLALKTFRRG